MTQASTWGVMTTGPASPDAVTARMNDSLNSLLSANKGSSAPSYKVAGATWIDDSNASVWVLRVFDGSQWVVVGTIDPVAHTAIQDVTAGGTGGKTAAEARTNLGALAKSGDTMTGTLRSTSAPAGTSYTLDMATSTVTLAAGANFVVSNFSGLLLFTDLASGITELWICGAGSASRIGLSPSSATSSLTVGYASAQSGYFVGNAGTARSVNLTTIRTRAGG